MNCNRMEGVALRFKSRTHQLILLAVLTVAPENTPFQYAFLSRTDRWQLKGER